jgi:hemoglobin-like flavoprotein
VNPQQVELVQSSFARLAPIAEPAAALFYGRLFEIAPETRSLFRGDMHAQGQKLMAALATVVDSLGEFEQIAPVVRDLARRHVAYGVAREHYRPVGEALIWTLEQGLAESFTPALRAAWAAAWAALSEVMIDAAYPPPAASSGCRP